MQQNLQKKVELASLKSEIDKIDVDKLETIPTDLNKLNDIVDKNAAQKDMLDKLVEKLNTDNSKVPTNGLVSKI